MALPPFVVKIEPNRLQELNKLLFDSSHVTEAKPTNQYEAFRVRCAGGTIVGYTSGKVVASGLLAESLLKDTVFEMEGRGRFDTVIGSDEAGKGEWLGPLVVSAVAVSSEQSRRLRAHGVMDSKHLSVQRIMDLEHYIKEHSLSRYTVLISPEKFNTRLAELHEEGKNLNDLLAWAHSVAVSNVYNEIGPSSDVGIQVVIDEFAREKTRDRLDRVMDLKEVNLVQRHQAEDEIAVAAASISARAARELWIDGACKSLKIELREMGKEEAKGHPEKHRFAKVQYLG
jgi:ribonuclease HIII